MTKVVKIGGFPQNTNGCSHSQDISVNPVYIGGNYPIAVQTMWKEPLHLSDLDDIAKKIETLGIIGCNLLRFAVPDIQTAEILGALAEMVSIPLVADIHFDYKIAVRCMDFKIAKIRINPGNIGNKDKVRIVLEKAGKNNIPIRIGVNAGSLPVDLAGKDMSSSEALVQAAQREMLFFKEFGFNDFLVSMKASTIADTINANRILSQRTDAPLHIGVTEAGPLTAGIVRNTAAIITLLTEGIGDTIRVSLSDTMENEIIAAREIIAAAFQLAPENKRFQNRGVNIISCPKCGRCSFDTHCFTKRWMNELYALNKDITVAIMGCEVNGPAEAKHSDLGITGAGNKVLVFRHGRIIRTISASEADAVFKEELNKL